MESLSGVQPGMFGLTVVLRNRLRIVAFAAAAVVPLVLALLPYVLTGSIWATIGLLGGFAAIAWGLSAGAAANRDLRALSTYLSQLEIGEATELPGLGLLPAHRAAMSASRLSTTLTERAERARSRLEIDDAIIEALPDPLLLVGSDRQVVRANASARNLFGDRVSGRDLAASLRQPDVLEAVDAVLAGGASRTVEYTLPVPVERVFEVNVKPFRRTGEEAGAASGRMVVLTLHNITAIRRSEQMRADFIANASHELRTPLSSLLGFIETLRGPAHDDADARERFLGIMHEQASRMSRLVQDLMSLSRIELDEHMAPNGRVDVLRSLEAVIAALELKARARGIHIEFNVPDDVPDAIGDDDQLTQVFQNLISNAVKYTREKTVVTVSVALTDGAMVGFGAAKTFGGAKAKPGQTLAVSVADRGEGIARVHLPRLTERFYRVDAARSRALGGTGLGLAIVKHIMNRHRGRLTIESEVGQGSTFTVYLPTHAEAKMAEQRATPLRDAAAS